MIVGFVVSKCEFDVGMVVLLFVLFVGFGVWRVL